MSPTYLSALSIILVAGLHAFGINIGSDVVSSLIVGLLALVVAIRRHGKGDITVLGSAKRA